jgi:molybdenum cofactor cytidylyltransferase
MGQAKVLLPWSHGRTILEHIIQQLIAARVDPIVVVTGHRADEVRPLAETMGAITAHNPDYATGEMLSSVKAGLRALPANVGAALMVLGDQPRIQPRVIESVLMAYAEGRGEIVAPSYQHRRGHPILIDRRYWGEILALPADGAPRDVINRHADRVAYVDVDTDSVLRDVDTPEDYRDERGRAGLA